MKAVIIFTLGVAVHYILTHLVGYGPRTPGGSFMHKKTMNAVTYSYWGEPDKVLQMNEIPVPGFNANEVLVEVHAAAINPADYKIILGAYGFEHVCTISKPFHDAALMVRR